MIDVLCVSSEAYPLAKTGGLGDVVGALPDALAPHGVRVTTLLPAYSSLADTAKAATVLYHYKSLFGVEARIVETTIDGARFLLLDAPSLFNRDGGLYGDGTGRDWPDNWRRFAALARAGADLASGLIAGEHFDILHAHDWQAAMAPAYLRYTPTRTARAKSVITIHNMAFQGRFERSVFNFLGLPPQANSIEGVEYYGGIGFLKAGLSSADAITTVSPNYADEICTPAFGMGLEGLLRSRAAVLSGIVNGIDRTIWNPELDKTLAARYTASTLDNRKPNKRAAEAMFGLASNDGPLFAVISRLTWQKGMDVLADQIDELVGLGIRLALLGSGDADLEEKFRLTAERHPGKVGVEIDYDEKLSHLLQGGADAIVVPSRFEPCGLTQLYGLAYGCVPIAARTGGLADTLIDANEAAVAAGVATGILFDELTADDLSHAIRRAKSLYEQPEIWKSIQRAGMQSDVSWQKSGARYAALYGNLIEARAANSNVYRP